MGLRISSKGIGKVLTPAQFKKLGHKPKQNKFNISAKDQRTADGTVFDSKLEKRAYEILRDEYPHIPYAAQSMFILQDGYRDEDGAKVRDIRMIPDFLLGVSEAPDPHGPIPEHVWVCDIKGMKLPDWILRAKIFGAKFGKKIRCLHSVEEIRKTLDEYTKYHKSLNR